MNSCFNMNDFFEGAVVFLTEDEAEHVELPANRRITHHNAISAWRTSRTALLRAFRAVGIPIESSDLKGAGIQQLAGFPDWRFSITHSDKYAAAWVARSGSFGMGVDLESTSRALSAELCLKIANSADTVSPDIRCWSLKEAIYKCFCGDKNQSKLYFNRIALVDGSFYIDGVKRAGTYFQEIKDNGIVLSYAKSFNRGL